MNADLDYNQIQNTQLMQAFKRIDYFLTLMMFQTHFLYFFQWHLFHSECLSSTKMEIKQQ